MVGIRRDHIYNMTNLLFLNKKPQDYLICIELSLTASYRRTIR